MKFCSQCGAVYPTDFVTCPRDQTTLSMADDLQPGMVIRDKYAVLEKLGAGGMAAVYRVRRVHFEDIYALKVVNKSLATDEQFVKRFRSEAVMAHRLQHPNVVRIFDLDTTVDGRPFMLLEFVDGKDLRRFIRDFGTVPVRLALDLAAQVADGLDSAHRLGVIHRDIKPDNILIARNGASRESSQYVAKIADFGIAKAREAATGAATLGTSTGVLIGTPQYMSPEHAMGMRSSELDGRSDLYSLAVVLYEMITGQLPFESDTPMGFLLKHLQATPPAPREIKPDLERAEVVTQLLMKGLAKDRERRFQTGAEMAAALRHPEAWAAKQQKIEAAAEMPTINIKPPHAATTSSNPIITPPVPRSAVAPPQPTESAEVAKPRRSGLRIVIGTLAVVFLLFVISIVGVIWYAMRSTKSASKEVNQAIQEATADVAREAADANSKPQRSPEPGTHSQHPESQGRRSGSVPPVVQPPKPPAAPGEDYGAEETARAMEEANKALSAVPPQNWNFDTTGFLLKMADGQLEAGNYHAAIGMYKNVLKRDPKNAAAKKGLQRAEEALKKTGPNSR